MKVQGYAGTRKHLIFSMLMVFGIAIIGTLALVYLSIVMSVESHKEHTQQLAQIQAGKIENVLIQKLQTCETVAILIKENRGDITTLEPWINEIVEKSDIVNISLAPQGIVTNSYPLKGNENAIGHNILTDPTRSTETQEAMKTRQLTLSGPYRLKQGIWGLIGRQVVYIQKDHGQEAFWGFSSVSLKLPDALKDADLDHLSKQNYTYKIYRTHPDTKKKQTILSNGTISADNITENIHLPQSTWYLSLHPNDGWVSPLQCVLRFGIALLISILITLLFGYVRVLAYNRNNLRISMEQQTENYHQMNLLNEELRSFRHDMKNHMLSVSNILHKKDCAQALQYINNINKTFLATSAIHNTENYVFDALLAEKKKIADSLHIHMECEVYLSRKLTIDNLDWTILFGNLLDNAIEACKQEQTITPYIHLQILCRGNMIHVKIANTCSKEPQMLNGQYLSTKQNAKWHGQGIKHIESIIRKYNGTIEITYDNQIFSISFMLCDI